MPDRGKAVAIDWDAASLSSLREALPGWEIGVVNGATATSPSHDWDPGAADLLVVKAREEVAEPVGLCRFLVFCGVVSTDSREEVAETRGPHGGLTEPGAAGRRPAARPGAPGQGPRQGGVRGGRRWLPRPPRPCQGSGERVGPRAAGQPAGPAHVEPRPGPV
jgi:hypothetical protein